MISVIADKKDQIAAICRQFGVTRLDVFGSAVRDADFDPMRSDVDFLVDFASDARHDNYADLKTAFERIFGRYVDIVDRRAIEQSRNYIRRRRILQEAQPLYVA